jgi:hypothetical protein
VWQQQQQQPLDNCLGPPVYEVEVHNVRENFGEEEEEEEEESWTPHLKCAWDI